MGTPNDNGGGQTTATPSTTSERGPAPADRTLGTDNAGVAAPLPPLPVPTGMSGAPARGQSAELNAATGADASAVGSAAGGAPPPSGLPFGGPPDGGVANAGAETAAPLGAGAPTVENKAADPAEAPAQAELAAEEQARLDRLKVAEQDAQNLKLDAGATGTAELSPEVAKLLARLDALSEEQRVALLTGRTELGSEGDRLLKDIGKRMDRQLHDLETAARAAGREAGNGWSREERVGRTKDTQPGYRSFDAQAKIFTKALTLYSEEVETRAVKMLMDRGAFDAHALEAAAREMSRPKSKNARRQPEDFVVSHWVQVPLVDRVKFVMEYSSVPGTSRHHWGTDVDVADASSSKWASDPRLIKLGSWLAAFAHQHGFTVAFNSDREGRNGGYQHEPWHLSDTELSRGILANYNQEMFAGEHGDVPFEQLMSEVAQAVSKLQAKYRKPGAPERQFDEAELLQALLAADVRQYIEGVDAQVKP